MVRLELSKRFEEINYRDEGVSNPITLIMVIRQEYGLTQKSIAMLIGVSETNISLWRRGRKLVPSVILRLLTLLYYHGVEKFEGLDRNIRTDYILKHRKSLKMSQSEYEAITGLDQRMVSTYESNKDNKPLPSGTSVMISYIVKHGLDDIEKHL